MYEVLIGVLSTVAISAVSWAVAQTVATRRATQQLTDHIAECDKRAVRNDTLLTRIDSRVDELYKQLAAPC